MYDGQIIKSNDWTFYGGGNDIWNTDDQFRFAYQKIAGDFSFSDISGNQCCNSAFLISTCSISLIPGDVFLRYLNRGRIFFLLHVFYHSPLKEIFSRVSYSVSQGCGGCAAGGTGTVDLKAEIKDSYLFGVKFSPSTKGALGVYVKAGMLFWDVAYTASNAQLTYDGTAKSGRFLEVDGSDAYMGIGASYAVGKNSSFAIDYMSSEIHDSDIKGYSLTWIQSF